MYMNVIMTQILIKNVLNNGQPPLNAHYYILSEKEYSSEPYYSKGVSELLEMVYY